MAGSAAAGMAEGAAGTVGQLFVWTVLGQLLSALLGPELQALANAANGANQEVPVSPADLALAVIRNIMAEGDAARQAAMSGISPANFHTLTLLTGDAPAPDALAEALRRGFIDQSRFTTGIRQGRLRDEWGPLMEQLATHDPASTLALTALLKGQTDAATAKTLFARWGGNPEYFDLAFHTEGASPTPVELGHLANRGVIPWSGTGPDAVSFEQGFLEGQWRNKWSGAFRKLAEYLPPPRTVVAMVREDALTHDQALGLLEESGLTSELAAAYLSSASHARTVAAKELAESTVHALYVDQLIDAAAATTFLERLRFTAEESAYILAVWDLQDAERFLRTAVGRVHALYVGHKIDQTAAQSALASMHVPNTQAGRLLEIWSEERSANVRTLTPAQVSRAFALRLIDETTAHDHLVAMGYTPSDADVILELAVKEPLAQFQAALAGGG